MALMGKPPLEAGETFLGMRVAALLGSGGSGWVYRVHEPVSGLEYALKLIPRSSSSSVMERTRKEFLILRELEHPNVVRVVRAGVTTEGPLAGKFLYLQMELVEGRTLRDVLHAIGALNVPEILTIGIQLAAAAEAAHSRCFVHRDLKPENVVIGAESNEVKVLDFGVAKVLGSPSNTTAHNCVGTPLYMSPESLLGNGTSPRGDVYAIGVMMDEMARGMHFVVADCCANEAPSAAYVRWVQIAKAPSQLHRVVPGFPRALSEVIAKAMAKDADARFRSAAELREALEELDEVLGRRDRDSERELVQEAEALRHPGVDLSKMCRATTEIEEPIGPPTAKGGAVRRTKLAVLTTREFDVQPLFSGTTVRNRALGAPLEPGSGEEWDRAALFGPTLRCERVLLKEPVTVGSLAILRNAGFGVVSVAVVALGLSAARSAEAPTGAAHPGEKAGVVASAVVPAAIPAIFRESPSTTKPAVERKAASQLHAVEPRETARTNIPGSAGDHAAARNSPERHGSRSVAKVDPERAVLSKTAGSPPKRKNRHRKDWWPIDPIAPTVDTAANSAKSRKKPKRALNDIVDPWARPIAPLVEDDEPKRVATMPPGGL